MDSVGPEFVGLPVDRLRPLWDRAGRLLADAPAARAGLEMALYDAWGGTGACPCGSSSAARQTSLVTDLTIPLVAPAEAGVLAAAASREGFRHLKIKVGDPQGHEADLARIGGHRAEPRRAWRCGSTPTRPSTPDEAVSFARPLRLGAAESRCSNSRCRGRLGGAEIRQRPRRRAGLRRRSGAGRRRRNATYCSEDAVDGVNVKLMKSGLAGALQIIGLCRAAGKKLMLGCMLEIESGHRGGGSDRGGDGRVRLAGPGLAPTARAHRRPGRRLHCGGRHAAGPRAAARMGRRPSQRFYQNGRTRKSEQSGITNRLIV